MSYRARRSGIESRWERDFSPVQAGPGDHPASSTMGTRSFPGVKCGRGVLLPITPFQCRGHGRVELYLYPPSGPHRACNGITLPFLNALTSQIYFWNKTLNVSDSSSVHHQGFFTVHTAMVYVIQVCCVYSEKPLMMDRGNVRNM